MGNGASFQPTYAPQSNHSETLYRNVPDNQFTTAAIQASATKLTYCPIHPGIPTCKIQSEGVVFEKTVVYPIACSVCLSASQPPAPSHVRSFDGSVVSHGTYIFKCGGKYEGQLKNGAPFGKEIHYCRGGYFLDGHWDGEFANGYGTKTFENGDIYQGCFKDNKYKGQGKFFCKSAKPYEYVGEFEDGKFSGWGTLSYGGLSFQGQFNKGDMEGEYEVELNGARVGKYFYKKGQLVSANINGKTLKGAELQRLLR